MTSSIKAAIAAALFATLAGPAIAEDGNSSLRSFHKEAAKAREAGGYGNPMTEVPTAVAEAIANMMTVGETTTAQADRNSRGTTTN